MSRSSAATSSSFSMGTFARALSPVVEAVMEARGIPDSDVEGAHAGAVQAARHMRMQAVHSAASIDQVIGLVPVDYRRQLADPLRDIATLAEKLEKARSQHMRLQRLVSDGWASSEALPTGYRVNVRDLQAYKDFLAATPEESASRLARLETLRAEYEKALVGEGVRLLKDEVTHYQAQLTPDRLVETLKTPVLARWKVLAADCQVPVIEFVKNRTKDGDVVMEDGEVTDIKVSDWKTDPSRTIEFEALCQDLGSLAMRILTLQRSARSLVVDKAEKKKAVVAEANIKTSDLLTSEASIQSLIDKAVNARMKAYSQYKPGQSSKGGVAVSVQDLQAQKKPKSTPTPSRKLATLKSVGKDRNKKAAAAKAAAKTAPAKQKASGSKDQKGKGKARK